MGQICKPLLEVEKNFMHSLSAFFLLLVTKKRIAFKSSLIRTLLPWLLNSFDLPSYDLESRKRYTLRLLTGSFVSSFACGGKLFTWGTGLPGGLGDSRKLWYR